MSLARGVSGSRLQSALLQCRSVAKLRKLCSGGGRRLSAAELAAAMYRAGGLAVNRNATEDDQKTAQVRTATLRPLGLLCPCTAVAQ